MYPKTYFDYFREFDTTDEVFVAMPFHKTEHRWNEIFVPAIHKAELKPFRVDSRSVGDSIVTDILNGIGRARLVLADLSDQEIAPDSGDPIYRPNPNVLYELGVAHATRLPEEVVIVREIHNEQTGSLPFDVTHIRYQEFDSKDANAAAECIADLLKNGLKEIERGRDLIVDKTLRSIDDDSADVIRDNYESGVFEPWREGSEGGPEVLYRRFVIPRLLDLGVLQAETNPEWHTRRYRFTELGKLIGGLLPDQEGWIVES